MSTKSPATIELLRSAVMVAAAAASKPSRMALSVLAIATVVGVAAPSAHAEGDSLGGGAETYQQADWQAGNAVKNFLGLGGSDGVAAPTGQGSASGNAGPLSKIVGGAFGFLLGQGAGKAMGASPTGAIATGALGAYAGVKVVDHLSGESPAGAAVQPNALMQQVVPAIDRLGSNVLAYRALAEQTHAIYKQAVLDYALNPRDLKLAQAVNEHAAAVNRDTAGLNVALKDLRQAHELVTKQYPQIPKDTFAEHRRIMAQGALPLQLSADFSAVSDRLKASGHETAFAVRAGQVEHLGMVAAQAQNPTWRQAPAVIPAALPTQQMPYMRAR